MQKVLIEDKGRYGCTANNSAGKIRAEFNLLITRKSRLGHKLAHNVVSCVYTFTKSYVETLNKKFRAGCNKNVYSQTVVTLLVTLNLCQSDLTVWGKYTYCMMKTTL